MEDYNFWINVEENIRNTLALSKWKNLNQMPNPTQKKTGGTRI